MVANIAILKNNLSKYVKAVREGEEVIVMDRNQPVARLVPYREEARPKRRRASAADEEARIDDLYQRGVISHRGDPAAVAAWAKSVKPLKRPAGTPALSDLLLKMREEAPW